MGEPAHRPHYSFREYVLLEDMANVRHEYLDGDIYAVAGGSPEHAAMASNLSAALHSQLRGRPCRVHSSDVRVRVVETGLATYPDVTVVCDELQRDAEDANTVVNPTFVAEVTSPSSGAYDRGDKRAQYQRIPALRAILIVAHDEVRVELWQRERDQPWAQTVYGAGEVVELPSLRCELSVDDVYHDELAPETSLVRRR